MNGVSTSRCEKLLGQDAENGLDVSISASSRSHRRSISHKRRLSAIEESAQSYVDASSDESNTFLDETLSKLRKLDDHNGPKPGRVMKKSAAKSMSSTALLGAYKSLENETIRKLEHDHFLDEYSEVPFKTVIEAAIHEKKWSDSARSLFEMLDLNKDTFLYLTEFVDGLSEITDKSEADLEELFHQFDIHNEGAISYDRFYDLMSMNSIQIEESLERPIRDEKGLIQVQANNENFFGESLVDRARGKAKRKNGDVLLPMGATKSQNFAMHLYESRIGSLQRFVSMTVMFHQMGWRVQNFFSKWSFGLIGYRMDRTHSIMRIATTASPVSGADVRDRKQAIYYMRKIHHAVQVISSAWLMYKSKESKKGRGGDRFYYSHQE